MTLSNLSAAEELGRARALPNVKSDYTRPDVSAVSWGAIFAGATAAAALSLILLILGTGLGLSSVSPWAHSGISATTFGVSTILWVTGTQLFASGMGGYIAGRLRTKWVAVHTDEVYFRDTAHGFLSWAVASLVTAALLTSVIGSIISGGIQAGATVVGSVATTATATTAAAAGSDMTKFGSEDGASMGYFVDSLFRKDLSTPAVPSDSTETVDSPRPVNSADQTPVASLTEVSRIFMNSFRSGALPAEDVRYLGHVVSQHTGLTQQNAEKRVTDTYLRLQTKLQETEIAAKTAANKARKTSSYAALWLFISLLSGAFVASLAATFGGRQRDF